MAHHRVVVIGGGNAGLSVAGRLRRAGVSDVVVIEPNDQHVFQPLQSHIAGGVARLRDAVRPQADVTPRGVEWVRDRVTRVDPTAGEVFLEGGETLSYDHLVVCPGIRHDWDATPGLDEAMQTPFGVSNYEYALAGKASLLLRDTRAGTAVFVETAQPATCNGSAQKPMYLACDYWRAIGVLDSIRVILVRAERGLFHVPEIDAELRRKTEEYGIEVRSETELLSVDPAGREITLAHAGGTETVRYEVLHAEPRQSAPGWIAASNLSDDAADGFVAIDTETFRSRRHPEVWSLGDAAATDSYKSGGAIRKQAKILVQNLVAVLENREPEARYDGYGVCPFTVSRGTVVFAEFDRAGELKPSIPGWRSLYRERRFTWVMDRWVLPWVYWNLILKGLA
jgi:sulfide:quinone oxidoreductase